MTDQAMWSRRAEGNKMTDATCVQSAIVAYYTERTATEVALVRIAFCFLSILCMTIFAKLPHGKDLLMRQLDCS